MNYGMYEVIESGVVCVLEKHPSGLSGKKFRKYNNEQEHWEDHLLRRVRNVKIKCSCGLISMMPTTIMYLFLQE